MFEIRTWKKREEAYLVLLEKQKKEIAGLDRKISSLTDELNKRKIEVK